MSCCAPARTPSRQEKDTFFDEMNSILSSVPAGEKYTVLGNFNARLGSRKVVGDQWSKVRGPHGCGVRGPHGCGVRSPHGCGVRGPHGCGVRSPHGCGVRGPHGCGVRGHMAVE